MTSSYALFFVAVAFAECGSVIGAMNFTVYSRPVRLRYGEVYNHVQWDDKDPLRLPEDVVARYESGEKFMSVSGFDVEMVRKGADGVEIPVLLSDHYLHHYALMFGERKGLQKFYEARKESPHSCHGMKGTGMRQFQAQMVEETGEPYFGVNIGSASGAEYRHNPQRFHAPYHLIMRRPEVWAPNLHIINTNAKRKNFTVSPLLECPCTPQRKIDVAAGTIDGVPPAPPIKCSAAFAATGNPSCQLSTYEGGWRCCEHGMFVIDTAKECKTPTCSEEPAEEVHMKFTFYYEDTQLGDRQVESAACCDVTSDQQGFENIEYDIPMCAEGTRAEQCVHIAESLQPVGWHYPEDIGKRPRGSDLVDLVYAAPHLHWAGISLELIDPETNKTLCEARKTSDGSGGILYGNGTVAGNEDGYLVGLRPCIWSGNEAPRFRRDHQLRTRAVYDASSRHTGVMSLWLMDVSAVPDADILV